MRYSLGMLHVWLIRWRTRAARAWAESNVMKNRRNLQANSQFKGLVWGRAAEHFKEHKALAQSSDRHSSDPIRLEKTLGRNIRAFQPSTERWGGERKQDRWRATVKVCKRPHIFPDKGGSVNQESTRAQIINCMCSMPSLSRMQSSPLGVKVMFIQVTFTSIWPTVHVFHVTWTHCKFSSVANFGRRTVCLTPWSERTSMRGGGFGL